MTSLREIRDTGARTLIDVLRHRADCDGPRTACIWLDDRGDEARRMTYADIDADARSCAAAIATRVPAASRVVLMAPSGPDFIRGFFGCLYAGTIPVPVHPARRPRALERARRVLADAQPAAIVGSEELLARVSEVWSGLSGPDGATLPLIDVRHDVGGSSFEAAAAAPSDLALLQYTSGSTSDPKGVMVRHEHVLHNQEMIRHAFRTSAATVVVSWLPMQHDMGLIGTLLHPIYMGCLSVLMSPEAAMANPSLWLRAISAYRGTISGGPNSAFDLCVDRISPDERAELDLPSWSVAFNGSEPVRHATMDRFAEAFGPCGFSRYSFTPCYGLAEATLIVSACTPREARRRATVAQSEHRSAIAAAGTPTDATRIAIADPEGCNAVAEGIEGEIWVSSPSVAAGYWQRPDLTAETFQAKLSNGDGPFLRTGDLGFTRGGTLYVTGRHKDLIIINGANYYPQDIEETARASDSALRSAPAAAFAVDRQGREGFAIVVEVQPLQEPQASVLAAQIRQLVLERHEVLPAAVVLVRRGAVPRTTNGKVQRGACRRLFDAGELPIVALWDGDTVPEVVPGQDPVLGWLTAAIADHCGRAASTLNGSDVVSRLGLESMAALQIAQKIERRFGVEIPTTALLADATLRDVAQAIRARLGDAAPPMTTGAAPTQEYPASEGQRSLWLHAQRHPHLTTYTIAHAVRIRGRFEPEAFYRAFGALIDRHDALRTVLVEGDGGLRQVVRPPGSIKPVPLQTHDASRLEEGALRAKISGRGMQPFDLAAGPLVRADLFRRAEGDHILLLAVHHAVADLWSMAVLMRDLGALYEAEATGRRAVLPPLAAQYADHVRRELAVLESDGERLWEFWRGQLAGDAPPLELPTDDSRPHAASYRCGVRAFQLSREASDRIRTVARTYGVTPYVVLLAGYVALLHRYSSQDAITVGSVVAGRDRADLADVIGYCVNTIALRCDVGGSPSFDALLPRIRRTVLQAFDHQAYPFPLIVERLRAAGGPDSGSPFNTMFVYQSTVSEQAATLTALALGDASGSAPWGGLAIEPLTIDNRTSNYPLTLVMAARDGGYAGALEFHSDRFEGRTADGIVEHYQQLLEAMLAEPGRRISDLALLSDAQRRQVLDGWNATAVDYGPGTSLHALIGAQASRTPEAVAVRSTSRFLTYAALNASANALAHYLASLGAGPESVVGIALERSCDLPIALLGVLKCGAAYMPIDRGYPPDRIRLMLADSECRLVVTDRQGAALIPESLARTVLLDADAAAIAASGAEDPLLTVDAGNAAYVIYTSGSTGRPKGVVNTHGGIVNRLKWMQDYFQLGFEDRVLQKTPYTFDVSVWEFFWPLMTGACVVMADPGAHQDAHALARAIESQRITTVHFVPSMLKAILHEPGLPPASHLRRVICSGEALPRPLQDEFLTRYDVELYNLYGPTEAAVDVTAWRCQGDATTSVPIGRPIANTRVYLLDRHLAPVPPGVAGELFIAGANVARGYLRRPALTADRFVPDPFDTDGRMYRTGDLARYRHDGAIEYLGRSDEQVKIAGARIELGEIEAVLAGTGLVIDAVAVARDSASGHKQVVAYVVPQPGARPIEIRQAAAQKLAPYMMPAAFVLLDALPLGPNGKIDKKQLPASDATRPDLANGYVAPRDPIEEQLAALWADALGVGPIGVEDNFFELGGHSLLITQLVSRMHEQFGVKVPMRSFFDAPTIADLADVVRNAEPDGPETEEGSDLLTQLEHLSEPELDDRLAAKGRGPVV